MHPPKGNKLPLRTGTVAMCSAARTSRSAIQGAIGCWYQGKTASVHAQCMCWLSHMHMLSLYLYSPGGRVHSFHQILRGAHDTKVHGIEWAPFTGLPANSLGEVPGEVQVLFGDSRCPERPCRVVHQRPTQAVGDCGIPGLAYSHSCRAWKAG